jgi:uncharacterized protein (DUF1800 family)
MSNKTTDFHRFARRVAFGGRLGAPIPGDPLAWAARQMERAPLIDLLSPDGARPQDLPADLALRWSMDEVMRAHAEQQQLVLDLRRRGRSMSPTELAAERRRLVSLPYHQLEHWKEVQARVTTALHGEAPVFERFWHFWTNHFTVAPGTQNNDTLVGPYQRHLREHMTGDFRTLLWHAATHPGMLVYLDNNRNTGPNSTAALRRWTRDTINENLGRELLELFTVSTAAGYSQQDVEATTLILTGWRDMKPGPGQRPGIALGTYFDFDRHEPGTQTVMGKPYRAWLRPSSKLEDLIADLAAHPATARHLARKLCVYFIDDDPPAGAVDHVESTFVRTRGHLPAVHAAVLEMAWVHLGVTRKFLSPEAWLLQTWTLSGLSAPTARPGPGQGRGLRTFQVLADLGQALPRCPQPDGWPIRSSDWVSREMLDRRVRFMALVSRDWLAATPKAAATLSARIDEHLRPDSTSARILQEALRYGDIGGAHTLFHISPELLWS